MSIDNMFSAAKIGQAIKTSADITKNVSSLLNIKEMNQVKA